MRDHTTMKVGGVADFYYEAKTINNLIKAVKTAIDAETPYFVLGNGSNVIFSDFGFPGLVIKNATNGLAILKNESQAIVDSGLSLQKLILEATSEDLSGLEFLFGIPGTVGGAIYGNAGAQGQSIGDYVKSVTVLISDHINDDQKIEPKVVQVDGPWLEFGYRTSKLKKIKGYRKPIILSARIQLARSRKDEIMRRLQAWQQRRGQTQPTGFSSGSIFKNPVSLNSGDLVGSGSKNMPTFPRERTAGFMLEKAGAKKLKVGGARVSSKHANFILNFDNAKAQDVRQLAEQMRGAAQNKFDVGLEEEIEYVGQW